MNLKKNVFFLHKQIPVQNKKITTQNQIQNLQRWKIMNEKKYPIHLVEENWVIKLDKKILKKCHGSFYTPLIFQITGVWWEDHSLYILLVQQYAVEAQTSSYPKPFIIILFIYLSYSGLRSHQYNEDFLLIMLWSLTTFFQI